MKSGLLDYPLHPFLFLGYFFLFQFTNNLGQVSFLSLMGPFALALLVVGVLFLVAAWRSGDKKRAAVAISLFVLSFFSYGHLYGLIYARLPHVSELGLHLGLTEVYLAIFLAGKLTLNRIQDVTPLNRTANTMAGILLVFGGLPAVGFADLNGSPTSDEIEGILGGAVADLPSRTGALPDIYLIILDGYSRADILSEHYTFDNRQMLDRLGALGFIIAPRSRSNYAWTALSLASLLNLRYVDELALGKQDHGRAPIRAERLIRNNRLVRILKEKGYRYVHFRSTWRATRRSPQADEVIKCRRSIFDEETYRALVESSFLRTLNFAVIGDLATCHLSQFDQLSQAGASPGPKFVFAHFIPPHHPYLFDQEGRVLRRATLANQMEFRKNLWADRKGYLQQLQFVNQRVLETIERILTESPRDPLIVLMSDHGPQLPDADRAAYLDARFANLVAVHRPGGTDGDVFRLPDDITSVNLFRVLLRTHLEVALEPLPDQFFYSTFQTPYRFTEITEELSRNGRDLGGGALEK